MYILVIALILFSYAFEMWLSIINYRNRHQPIPDNVSDVYEPDRYQKWLAYTMDGTRFSWIVRTIQHALVLILFLSGFFPWIQGIAAGWTSNLYLQTLFFMFSYFVLTFVTDLPLDYYRRFTIEAKFGFNRSTKKTFLVDKIKTFFLTLVLGGSLLYLFQILHTTLGVWFYASAWASIVLIQLIVNLLYAKVFIRIFNKLSPLEEGELKGKILAFAKQTGYEVKAISVMNASKRSTKLNAFFSGFGRFKQVVLYDTLIGKMSSDEIVSVLAHEIGHGKHKDIQKNFVVGSLVSLLYVVIVGFLVSSADFAAAFGFAAPNFAFGIILFTVFMSPLDALLQIPLSALSRHAEFRADAFAAKNGYREAMISALKVLARTNLSNLTPHPILVKLTYSHPPMHERIQALGKVVSPALKQD